MYELDVSGLQYLTADAYPEIHHDVAAYNRQARWVNGGQVVLDANRIQSVLLMLQNLDAMATSLSRDENAPTAVREEAGTLLAGISYATSYLNNPAPNMAYSQNPGATYTEQQYFDS